MYLIKIFTYYDINFTVCRGGGGVSLSFLTNFLLWSGNRLVDMMEGHFKTFHLYLISEDNLIRRYL